MENIPDIMADSQTESVLAALDRGEADSKLMNRVLAALLRAQTKMLGELTDIRKNLWDMDRLEQMIDRRHQVLCANCTLKQAPAKPPESKKSWLEVIVTSESVRYFILVVILVWAVIYVKSGPEGVQHVREAATHTVTGGVK
jgi:hypothetical protein